MELKTILRFQKIKTFNELNLSNSHVYRYMTTPNANPKINNKKIIGSGNVVRDVKNKLNTLNIKPRKNAVICVEGILSLSPEFFKKNSDVKDFAISARRWLLNEFGSNLVSAVLHLDEKTPHIHTHIIPITKDNRLSARDIFNKNTLVNFQKSYLNEMKNIEPKLTYNKGSKIEHVKLKDYYTIVNNKMENIDKLNEKNQQLENKIEQYEDVNFLMKKKIDKLERINDEQQKEILRLNSELTNISNNQKNEDYTFPKLDPINFPDNIKSKNKKKNKLTL